MTTLIFVGASFLSALLLFLIQPLFTKMVLPLLGGSSSVWAVALFFFQSALLAGYLYAHMLNRRFPPQTAGLIHLAIMGTALVFLPIGVPEDWREPSLNSPYLWQLALFAWAIGLPFVVIAANAPLLQAWFARLPHPNAADPYFMYAASNLGSLLALLGYPLLLEPVFGVTTLSLAWSFGFLALLGAIGLAYWTARQDNPQAGETRAAQGACAPAFAVNVPTWQHRAGWTVLAFVPSALLTAVTNHIATDVASAPLIWVLPLALYLSTYVLVFRSTPVVPMPVLLTGHLVLVVMALLELAQTRNENWFFTAAIGLGAFFTAALVAHRTLYELRPNPEYLTEFYLWLATGGVLGGLFSGIIAPQMFSQVFEYPLLLALTLACRPGLLSSAKATKDEWIKLWAITAAGLLILIVLPRLAYANDWFFGGWGPTFATAVIFAVVALICVQSTARQLIAALLMCATVSMLPSLVNRGDAERSFFGVYRVLDVESGQFKVLLHGTTLHGAQRVRDEDGSLVLSLTPATYYHPDGPMAAMVGLAMQRARDKGRAARIGVVGLGTGSLACYADKGDRWKFFEIDPLVVKIASDPLNFSYLHYCKPSDGIEIGDARLTIAKEEDAAYDALVIDAFSSDAVPVHLLTKQALELYLRKLRPDGLLVLHISNRYLDLEGVVSATLRSIPDALGYIISNEVSEEGHEESSSTVAVIVRSKALAKRIGAYAESRKLAQTSLPPWTDDRSDILRPIISAISKPD